MSKAPPPLYRDRHKLLLFVHNLQLDDAQNKGAAMPKSDPQTQTDERKLNLSPEEIVRCASLLTKIYMAVEGNALAARIASEAKTNIDKKVDEVAATLPTRRERLKEHYEKRGLHMTYGGD